MSNVQLSSSTLERLAARRTFPLHARTGACRNLFGPVDHEELNREMKSKLREISERDQRRWNFNFETDTPLSGDYAWEEASVDAMPVFYQDSLQIGKSRIVVPVVGKQRDCTVQAVSSSYIADDHLSDAESAVSRTSEVNQENCSEKLNSGKPKCKAIACVRRKRTSTTDLTSTTITHITDFYGKRKRINETKQIEDTSQNSAPTIHVEQTPRRRIR
ncbi:cyclin-dependent kinase inhibitor 1B-like [Brienomyrus brachyistius]|uniref:cyclin-dependent kinase inhibitor 1B-like n=1 Tax=Brienomyrus brachyistius TaxID=42636 RepID=UPI0020B35C77|nr:cyclin-dependent kinase inhibitor 1B-like [Brienomyrus brachyistius]